MLKPQQILKDYSTDKYLEQNTEFLFPVYQSLFQDLINKPVNISKEFSDSITELKSYFRYIQNLANKNNLSLTDALGHDAKSIGKLIESIGTKEVEEAVSALNVVVNFLKDQRSNINNLEFLSWALFKQTRKDDIQKIYLDNPDKLKEALLNPVFLILLLKYSSFGDLIIQDLLIPAELKNPSRMKGSFGDKTFHLIFDVLKKNFPSLLFKLKTTTQELSKTRFWYITEKTASAINFPKSRSNSKKVDMVSKIDKVLFVCSHKEQRQGGGAQDNQAEDAGSIFEYDAKTVKNIKSLFNVNKVFFCIFLEGSSKVINSNHWAGVTAKVGAKKNKDKYLLNSFQFIQLLMSR